jgi:hypothetical protein
MRDSGAAISAAHIRDKTSVYTAQSSRSAAEAAGGKEALESKVYKIGECSVCLRCDTVWLDERFVNSMTALRLGHYDPSKRGEPNGTVTSHHISNTMLRTKSRTDTIVG